MLLTQVDPTTLSRLLASAAHDRGARRFLRVEMSKLAGAAQCSTTTLRKYLAGEPLGAETAARVEEHLGSATEPNPRASKGPTTDS